MSWVLDTLKIDNKNIAIRRGEIEHRKLVFYPENPRLYSILKPDEIEPDQDEIQRRLIKMDHVKALVQDIKANGGLIDPIIVRDGTYDVLEGNSRLAAYRRLSETDPIKWGNIKCVMLPKSIDEGFIFRLLGQYHIIGKKDWAPFEQAGFLFRRHKRESIDLEQVAKEVGLPLKEVKQLVLTYEFMIDNDDTDINKWSYYYEMLKSRKISTLKKKIEGFQEALVKKIKSGEINRAVDIRDGVAKLADARQQVAEGFAKGEISLEDALERMEQSGNADGSYQRLRRFRIWLIDTNTEASIQNANAAAKKKMVYELGQLSRQIDRIKAALQ